MPMRAGGKRLPGLGIETVIRIYVASLGPQDLTGLAINPATVEFSSNHMIVTTAGPALCGIVKRCGRSGIAVGPEVHFVSAKGGEGLRPLVG